MGPTAGTCPAGYSFDDSGGRGGGKCLVYERADGGAYNFGGITFPVSKLVPGVTYTFGCWIKSKGVGGGSGAGMIVEFGSRYGYMGGIASFEGGGKSVSGDSDWKWIEGRFVPPPLSETFVVRPWLTQDAYGKVWFDDIKVYPSNPAFVWEAWRVRPMGGLTTDDGRIVIRSEIHGMALPPPDEVDTAKMLCSIDIEQGGKTLVHKLASAADMWIDADLGKLAGGDYAMKLALLDPERKLILGETSEPLHVDAAVKRGPAPKGACVVDDRGRCIVDGKPFMPVGVYCLRLDRENIRTIAQGGFNTVAPYELLICDMDSDVDPNAPGQPMKSSSLETVRATLDECHRNGLKVSVPFCGTFGGPFAGDLERFGVSGTREVIAKTVEAFKNNPAVLTWYICDEPQLGTGPVTTGKDKVETWDCGAWLRYLHKDIKDRDPWHPIWTVLIGCGVLTHDYRPFVGISDVMAIDVYPLDKGKRGMDPINLYSDKIVGEFGDRHGAPVLGRAPASERRLLRLQPQEQAGLSGQAS